jgi:putative hemolysin
MIYRETDNHMAGPAVLGELDRFQVKLAETEAEMEQAFQLRYQVFNLEQGKGLKAARQTGMDQDEYDPQCLHMIAFDKRAGAVIGTYRVNFGPLALSARGFYSAREYAIAGLDQIALRTMEVGRSCVAVKYRRGVAVALLWQGLAALMMRMRMRYLLGCVSLDTVDPVASWALYDYFERTGMVTSLLSADPVEQFRLDRPSGALPEYSDDEAWELIPPLFKGYLRVGTQICGRPALDYEFGTVDYLIVQDMEGLPTRYCRRFKYEKDRG